MNMDNTQFTLRLITLIKCVPVCAMFPFAAFADCPPNLRALPAMDLRLAQTETGRLELRFGATSWNAGGGPLVILPKLADRTMGTQRVDQRIYKDCNRQNLGYKDRFAGYFRYHPYHLHFHFDDYATYLLEAGDGTGSTLTTSKTTFCVMDTASVNLQLANSSRSKFYSFCGTTLQGMSVGWGDTYGSHLYGQSIDVSTLETGSYRLRIVVDPMKRLVETNANDNESCVQFQFSCAKDVSGLCTTESSISRVESCAVPKPPTVTSITPSSIQQGRSVAVTVTGSEFVPEQQLYFQEGTGPVPVARNVRFISGSEIQVDVSVPRLNFGGDVGDHPVWDLFLGSQVFSHVGFDTIPDALTVTP